jgi:prepilin-type N-terminal cleavage/methylation domain
MTMKSPSTRAHLARSEKSGFTTLEVIVAVLLVALVVVFTGRVIVTSIALIGRGTVSDQQGARARSQASAWIQAVTEYTRKVGFETLQTECPSVPCQITPVPSPTGAYAQAPPLPQGFQCGSVRLSRWDGTDPSDPEVGPSSLRLVTVEIYEQACGAIAGAAPALAAHTAIARRTGP